MDGRRMLTLLCGGLLVGAVGCTRQHRPGEPVGFDPKAQAAALGSTKWPGAGSTSAPPGTPVQTASDLPARKPGQPFKPETDAAIADVRAEAAFADGRTADDRERLIDQARQGYQKALKKDPKCRDALVGLARLYAKLGDKEKSVQTYRTYLEHHPKDHEVAHEVAVAHGRWKDWDGAAKWCEHALSIDPENRTYRKTLGFSLARAGRMEEGFAALCQVMPEPQARFNVARVMEHVGQADGSRQQLRLAIQADPAFAAAREFLAELDGQPPAGAGVAPPNPVVQASHQEPAGQ